MTISINGGSPVNTHRQTFFLQPDVEKTYAPTSNKNEFTGSLELFAGFQAPFDDGFDTDFFWQLGLALSGANNSKIKGDIWEDANPNFNNYSYSYNVIFAQLALKGKLFMVVYDLFDAYVSAGVGVGFNQASSFNITPKICQEVAAPAFTDKSSTGLTYSGGFGVQTALSLNWKMNLGYEFINLGPTELGRAPGQTLGSGLKLNQNFANTVTLGVTYII